MHKKDAPPLSRRHVIATGPLVSLASIGSAAPAVESAFSPAEMRLIEAFVDRLIPTDENGPGARESGVPIYIDRSFAGALAREKSALAAGLAATDLLARSRHGQSFAELDVAKQDAVLTAMENNEASGFTPDSRTFFFRLRQLTLEGMFGDPFYGGNRGFAGWDLIRYPGPRLAVSPQDQAIGKPIKPLRTSAHGGRHGN